MKLQIQESIRCHHCGGEIIDNFYIQKENDKQYYFCCNGCLQAFLFINDLGYGDYYNKREDYASKPESDYIGEALYDFIENDLKSKQETKILEKTFYIKGIHCASCVWINEKILTSLRGVIEANVSLSTNRVQLKWDPNHISLKEIGNVVHKIGYSLVPISDNKETPVKNYSDTLLKKMAVAGFFMGNNMLISASLYAGYFDYMDPTTKLFFHWMSFFLTIPVYFYSASEFFKSSYISLKNKVIATDLLTSIGISLAFFYSLYITVTNQTQKEVFFDAINFVVFVILIGRFVESRLKLKTWYYKTNLSSLNPELAKVLINHHLILRINDKTILKTENNYLPKDSDFAFKKLEEVHEKDIILVSPQEIVPLDCILLNSKAEIDESSLTGEFKPILKNYKELIASGSKNISNTILFLEVKHTFKESTISRILELAENSLLTKSRFETITTKISGIFISLVLTLGIITFLYWYYYKEDLSNAILYTLSLLIVACPCALSLSIPTAIIVGLQELFSKGCLVQNTQFLETIAKSKIIAFDKTGTLTQGNLNIYKVYSKIEMVLLKNFISTINNYQRELLIQHPISEAFYKFERENQNPKTYFLSASIPIFFKDENYKPTYYPGLGFELSKEHYKIRLGSEFWFRNNNYKIDVDIEKEKGDILVLLGYELNQEKYILAYFLLKDELKKNVEIVIPKLNENYTTILLTGDNEENARWIQEKTQISKIYFSLKPEDKAKIIQNYQKNNQKILMIGDGINDTIALKQADAGISFITASNLALYSADIFLINHDFEVVYYIINFIKFIFKKIKQNLTMSLGYNLILLPMAFFGYLSPFVGAVFMSLSSITVVLNSLSIKKYKQV